MNSSPVQNLGSKPHKKEFVLSLSLSVPSSKQDSRGSWPTHVPFGDHVLPAVTALTGCKVLWSLTCTNHSEIFVIDALKISIIIIITMILFCFKIYILATACTCSVQDVNVFEYVCFSLAIKIERAFYLDTLMVFSCFLITAPLMSVSMAPSLLITSPQTRQLS